MPTLLTTPHELPPSQMPPRKLWTREQCAELEAAGVFKNERIELVGGELISKMGKNRPHVNAFRILHWWLLQTFGKDFVDAEAPIDVGPEDYASSEPEPDLIVLNRECGTFVSSNPQPTDIRLVAEISDSTLAYDLSVKAALYARAGIAEYWVIDVGGHRLFCHREPISGRYTSVVIYEQNEAVSPLGVSHTSFSPGTLH